MTPVSITQFNSPTKPNYFQFPLCSHCFKPLFFAHVVFDIWNDYSHDVPCCVAAKFTLKSLGLVSIFFGNTSLEAFSPHHTPPPGLDLSLPLFVPLFAHRIILEVWFPLLIPVRMIWRLYFKQCHEEPTELVPDSTALGHKNRMLDLQGMFISKVIPS